MSLIETRIQEREAQTTARAAAGQRRLVLCHRGRYVFDGNRVMVHRQPDGKGKHTWWLETVNPEVWLAIDTDLRVHVYRRLNDRWTTRVIKEFETVFDALAPLDQAICNCAKNSHTWSLSQYDRGAACVWQWCLCCGAEQLRFPDTRAWLIWPADAFQIAMRTAGVLPTLHGPIVGGVR